MRKRTKILTVFALAASGAIAAVLTLPSAFAGSTASFKQEIYKITFTTDSTNEQSSIPEWASLATGTWRVDVDDQVFISSDDSYVVIDTGTGSVYRRTGSPSFMGDLHVTPLGVLALSAHLKGDPSLANRGLSLKIGTNQTGKTTLDSFDKTGKHVFTVTIDQQVTDEEAATAHLLDTAPSQPHVTDTQLPVGLAPSSGINAYWFGRAVNGLVAVTAAEHARVRTDAQLAARMTPRAEGQVHVTFYERPGVPATSAQPGLHTRPEGELQVSSELLNSAHAQGLVDAFNGKNGDVAYTAWPGSTVTLADGQQAVVVANQFDGDGPVRTGFFVLTTSTLVSVSGDVALSDIPTLAATLRPLT